MSKYLIVIEKAKNNYSAYSPDVLGCIATGDTIEETIKEMKSALEFHFEDLEVIPEPKSLRWHIETEVFEFDTPNSFITTVEMDLEKAA